MRLESLPMVHGAKMRIKLQICLWIIQLFQSSNPDSTRIEAVLEATPQTVTAEMNQALLANFIKLEVDFALKLMTPLKALGLDGLPPIFY